MNDHGANSSSFLSCFESKEKFLSNFKENYSSILRINMKRFQILAKTIIESKEIPLENLLEAHMLCDVRYSVDFSKYVEHFCNNSLSPLCRKLPKYDATLWALDKEVKVITLSQAQEFMNKLSVIQTFVQDDFTFVLCCMLTLLKGEDIPQPIYQWLQKLLRKHISNMSYTFPNSPHLFSNANEAIKDFFKTKDELFLMLSTKLFPVLPTEECL